MDSEKHNEIQELIDKGRSPSDEGPFYHHTFWESYKGSIKGKLGGTVIGTLMGAAVGAVVAALLPAAFLGGVSAMTVVGAFAAAGMLYANHEFGEIGRITGAISAAEKDAESRIREFEQSKFNELKQEISELKTAISGGRQAQQSHIASPSVSAADDIPVEEKLDKYRVSHHDPEVNPPKGNGVVFWKVAVAGLVVGAAVGALLSLASVSIPVIGNIAGMELMKDTFAAAATFGAIGASFGINRDLFRKVFDKTDMLFKGFADWKKGIKREKAVAIEPEKSFIPAVRDGAAEQVNTLVYQQNAGVDYPASDTFHRDRLAARASQALAAIDHTTAIRH